MVLVPLLIAFPHTSSAAGLALFDDFESYSVGALPFTGIWNQDRPYAPQVVTSALDAGLGPHSGSKMMRANWFGSPGDFEGVAVSLRALYNNEGFIRVWFRFDADFQNPPSGGSGAHLLRLYPDPSFFISAPDPGPDPTGFQIEGLINGVQFPSVGLPNIVDHQWHKFELYWKISPPIMRGWLDGVLKEDIAIAYGPLPDVFYLMSNMGSYQIDQNNHVYMDDFEFFSDTGKGAATGLMSDATICQGTACKPPKPPNLRIQ